MAPDSAAPDIVVNGKSLRDYLRANMHDGDEGGTVTMPVKVMLDETQGEPGPARQLHPRRLHGGSDLDRHADALATLAGFVRRAFIEGAR